MVVTEMEDALRPRSLGAWVLGHHVATAHFYQLDPT